MASQGKYGGREEITSVFLIDTANSITCILDDEATDPWYAVAPFDCRLKQFALYYSEAVDGTPVLTATNGATGESSTVTIAAASIDTAAIATLAAEISLSQGDVLTVTTDGGGTTGQGVIQALFKA